MQNKVATKHHCSIFQPSVIKMELTKSDSSINIYRWYTIQLSIDINLFNEFLLELVFNK